MSTLHKILLFLLFVFIFSFSFTTSSDFNQDLGRHLKIGEIITQTKTIPSTNTFSYTNSDFPFTNHHWLSEVIFYQIAKIFGLNALIVLKTILIVAAFGFIISLSILLSNPIFTLITTLLFAPLFIGRALIRPELFGFLFFSIVLFLICTYPKTALSFLLFQSLWLCGLICILHLYLAYSCSSSFFSKFS